VQISKWEELCTKLSWGVYESLDVLKILSNYCRVFPNGYSIMLLQPYAKNYGSTGRRFIHKTTKIYIANHKSKVHFYKHIRPYRPFLGFVKLVPSSMTTISEA
jgi:hypothetical protein